ncbi:hypothetical protein [Mycoplasma sp. P36-A1]|uniref:hypothetical protein n=1 Tax=Mycoplasma sp. P36-A1 TaxID=3252900 RepID=UPI003C2D8D7D
MIYLAITIYIICILLFFKIKSKNKNIPRNIVSYSILVAIIFPVLGIFLGMYLLNINQDDIHEEWLKKYDDLLIKDFINYTDLTYRAKLDQDITPIIDGLNLKDPQLARHLLLELASGRVENEGKYIKAALKSKNKDIVHYSATMFVNLINKYHLRLAELYTEYDNNNNNLDTAIKICDVYQRLLSSHLLYPEDYTRKVNDYYDFIIPLVKDNPDNIEIKNYYLLLLMNSKEFTRAKKIALNMLETNNHDDYTKFHLMKIALYQKDWNLVKTCIKELNTNEANKLSEKDHRLLLVVEREVKHGT